MTSWHTLTMGDAGEGWVDAEARIQERMEELQRERGKKPGRVVRNPEVQRAIESLKLARTELERQLKASVHAGRKAQLTHALADVDRKITELTGQEEAK